MQPHSSIVLQSARRPTLLAAALCSALAAMAQTPPPPLPEGKKDVAGFAHVHVTGTHMQITTQNAPNAQHSATDWTSFSVAVGHSVRIQQPTAASMSINRVVAPNPSLLMGGVSSNGQVVLVNPYGITVGPGAVIDTARFTASTLGMSEADAAAGRLRFAADGVPGPLVVKEGAEVVARGGDVVLLARDVQVESKALVRSEGGAVILAAGRKVEITGRGLEGIRLEVQAPSDRVVNLGTLQGDAVGIFAGTLRHSGAIRAQTATLEGGRVVLKAQKDIVVTQGAVINADGAPGHAGGHITLHAGESVQVAGTLSAQSATLSAPEVAWTGGQPPAGPALPLSGKGGRVEVLGQAVRLEEEAGVDVSGDAGGGTILVGGDYQGANPEIPNAKETFVAPGVNLVADARARGDGGKVIVWADSRTRFYGHLSARGGEFGGNGGIGETSGKEVLLFRGSADLTARRGRRGTLLLDPDSITVGDTANINGDGSLGDDISSNADLDNATADQPGAASQITAAQLATLLNTADVMLAATNVITIASAISKTMGSATTLTLSAPVVNIDAAIAGTASNALNLTVNASTSVTLNALYSYGTLNLSNPTLTLGASAGLSNVTLGSDVTLSGTTLAVSNGLQIASGRTFNIGSTSVALSGSQTFSTGGSANIVMAGGSFTVPASQTLALSSGLTVRGYGNFYSGGAGSTLVNNGTIDADQTGQFLLIRTANFTNNGTLRASTGSVQLGNTTAVTNAASGVIQNDNGRLEFGSVITNAGNVNLNGGLTLLGGSLTPTTYTTGWNRSAGELRIMGTLNLGGGTLDIGAGGLFGAGGLGLQYGTISNGMLRSADGSLLSGLEGTLQNMTIGSNLSSTVDNLYIVGGLVLADGTTFDIGSSGKFVYFSGTQTISTAGQATVRSQGASAYVARTGAGQTLTIGSGVTWRGYGSIGQWSSGGLVNNGTIDIDGVETTLSITPDSFTNNGKIRLQSSTFSRSGGSGFVNGSTGKIAGTGTINLYGGTLVNQGVIEPGGSGAEGSLYISGNLDTGAGTLQLEQHSVESYDRISVSGNVVLGGPIARADLPGATYGVGDVFYVLDFNGTMSGTPPEIFGFSTAVVPGESSSFTLTAKVPAGTAAPAPAPAPAPATSTTTQAAIVEQNNLVTTFLKLLQQELTAPAQDNKDKAKEAIEFSDAGQCKR